jgi:IS4 transposase
MEINGQLEIQVALHREKSAWYHLDMMLEGRKRGLDALGKKKCIAPFWNRATIQPVAKSQHPLCHPGSPSFNVLV